MSIFQCDRGLVLRSLMILPLFRIGRFHVRCVGVRFVSVAMLLAVYAHATCV